MKTEHDGKTFGIPRSRRLSWDLLYFNQGVPLCGHSRWLNLGRVAELRKEAGVRISWPALFLKAFGLLAQQYPELRQMWSRWPWARLYQHPGSVGILTVQREYRGERWLFWGRIPMPEQLSLVEIQNRIDVYQTGAVEDQFKRELQLVALPTVFRRLIWAWNLHFSGAKRPKRLGTFFLSTLSGMGVEIQIPPSVQTCCLTYGPLSAEGKMKLTIAYDHRVMDGALIAECLCELERVFSETITAELLKLRSDPTKMAPVTE